MKHPTTADLSPEDQADALAILAALNLIGSDATLLAVHRVLERVRVQARTVHPQ